MIGKLIAAGSFVCLFVGFTLIGAALATTPPAPPPPSKSVTATQPARFTWVCDDPTTEGGTTLKRECQRVQLDQP